MFIAKHFWHQVLLLGLSINQSSFHAKFKLNCHCQSTVKFRIEPEKVCRMEMKGEFNWQKQQNFILFKQGFLLLLLSLQTFGTVTAQPITGDVKPCLTKTCPNGGIVCVCNATYCDSLPSSVVEGMVGHDGAAVIYSSMSGARWQTSRQPFGQQTS